MTKYKLQTDVTYYVTNRQGVLFIEPGRKMLANKASTWLFKQGHKVVKSGTMRTGQEFEIELRKNEIWVKHPKLMGGKDYFEVLNQIEDNLLDIVQNIDIIDHKPNAKFELLMFEGLPDGYHPYLSCPGMETYEEAWNEFVRTVNIQRKSRTKKIVAGHRYDTPGCTLWCLGDFNGTLGFVVSKKDTTKKISELMGGLHRVIKIDRPTSIRCYNEYSESDLILSEHPGLMTDSGLDLEMDWTGPVYKYWTSWINSGELENRRDYLKLYNLLSFTHPKDLSEWPTWEPTVKPALEKLLKDYLLHIFIAFEGRECRGLKLSVGLKDKDLFDMVRKVYVYSWTGNRESAEDSLNFMADHGVDIDKIILEVKADFEKIDFNSLENILKYHSRLLNLNKDLYVRSLTFSRDEEETDGGKIRGLFNNQTLSDTIVEMLKLAQENLNLVSNLFSYLGVYQYSKKSIPDLNIKLSLQNVIDYMGGYDTLTESFKEALIAEKFLTLDVSFRRNLVIL